jgi:hypothetical protein
MKRVVTGIALTAFALLAVSVGAQDAAKDVQQKLAAAKEAAARNQKALRAYSWIEKTELSSRAR